MEGRKKYTIEEYLELELRSTEKYEYYQGEIIPTGLPKTPFESIVSERQHNTICSNLLGELGRMLRPAGYKVYDKNLSIYIGKHDTYCNSDITVITSDAITLNDDGTNVLNPTIAIEVLSSLTREYDKGEKFSLYRDIPTLREFILVDSDSINVQAYYINKNGVWALKEYENPDEVLEIPTIQVSISLKDIYDGVNL